MTMRSVIVVVLAAVAVTLVKDIAATSLTVGDESGWVIPPSPDFYSSWAAEQTVAVGDILVFDFVEGAHTVAKVTLKDAYEGCDATLDPNAEIHTSSIEVPLATEGDYYFFCTVGNHCLSGLKFAISVSSNATIAPASSNPPAEAPTDSSSPAAETLPVSLTSVKSPDNNSAFGISAFPVSFMALIISFAVLLTVSQ